MIGGDPHLVQALLERTDAYFSLEVLDAELISFM